MYACWFYSLCKFSFSSQFLTNTLFHYVVDLACVLCTNHMIKLRNSSFARYFRYFFFYYDYYYCWYYYLEWICISFSNKLSLMFTNFLNRFLCCISCETINVYMCHIHVSAWNFAIHTSFFSRAWLFILVPCSTHYQCSRCECTSLNGARTYMLHSISIHGT